MQATRRLLDCSPRLALTSPHVCKARRYMARGLERNCMRWPITTLPDALCFSSTRWLLYRRGRYLARGMGLIAGRWITSILGRRRSPGEMIWKRPPCQFARRLPMSCSFFAKPKPNWSACLARARHVLRFTRRPAPETVPGQASVWLALIGGRWHLC